MRGIAWLLAILVAACGGGLEERFDEIDRLHLAATGPGGSAAQIDAIRRLAERQDPRVDDLIARIAQAASGDQVRAEAIRQLRRRDATTVAPQIASLLSPESSLELRQEIALAYAELGCPETCIESTLGYLERIWEGERDLERRRFDDRHARDPGNRTAPAIASAIRERQNRLYEAFYALLRRHEPETVSAMSRIYGLGEPEPSAFALHLTAYLQLRGACPALLASREPVVARGRGQEILSAIEGAGCEAD